jgi:hypothetical protein
MHAVKALKNQYLGINAHLHSYWQAGGDWSEFHASYIIDLSLTLKAQLAPLGYVAGIQKSIQIRRANTDDGKPESDITIYDTHSTRPFMPAKPQPDNSYDMVLDLPEVLEAEEDLAEFRAITIYEAKTNAADNLGEPVAWIEVLSPSNKPGGQHAYSYQIKRRKLLDSAIVFVEIDYLHESPPTFSRIPRYRPKARQERAATNAHPYRIVVIDPRPIISQGKLYTYQFDVEQTIPVVPIPLSASDLLQFDFGRSYHRTLEDERFTYMHVNYQKLPVNFNRYSQSDQQCIANRMLAVLEAAQQGTDLETGPFPTQSIPLEEALKQIEAFQQV